MCEGPEAVMIGAMRAMLATARWAVAMDCDLHALTIRVRDEKDAAFYAAIQMFPC